MMMNTKATHNINLLTLHTEAAQPPHAGGVHHTSPLGVELDQPEASTAQ